MRDSMLFYRSFYDAVKDLDAESFKKAVCTLLNYGLDGISPDTTGIEKTIFILAKPQIDKNNVRYQNAKKGGRKSKPSSNQNDTKCKPSINQDETKNEPSNNQTYTKRVPNVNDNDKANVNGNVNNIISSEVDKSTPSSPIVAKFILNDKSMYEVSAADVAHFKELYPAVDIEQELRNITGWCDANPKNRKTRAGAKRFMTAWFSRAQNSARLQNSPAANFQKANTFHNFEERNYDFDALERAFDEQFCSKVGQAR